MLHTPYTVDPPVFLYVIVVLCDLCDRVSLGCSSGRAEGMGVFSLRYFLFWLVLYMGTSRVPTSCRRGVRKH